MVSRLLEHGEKPLACEDYILRFVRVERKIGG